MKSRRLLPIACAATLMLLLVTTSVSTFAAPPSTLETSPAVAVEVSDELGAFVPDTPVVIRSVTDSKWEVSGKTGKSGSLSFRSKKPETVQPGKDIVDAVYTAYVKSADGQIVSVPFSVPHVVNEAKVDSVKRQMLEADRVKTVKITLPKKETAVKGAAVASQSDVSAATTVSPQMTGNCTYMGGADYLCTTYSELKQAMTRVGKYNVSNGLNLRVTLESTAKNTISAGIKNSGDQNWSTSGSVQVSVGSKTWWDVSGTCVYVSGMSTCHPARVIFGNYQYRYEAFELWSYGILVRKWSQDTPVSFVGPVFQTEWAYESRNGKPASDVRKGNYGLWYETWSGGAKELHYSTEISFSIGGEVPTPFGTFLPSVSTVHTSSNTLAYTASDSTIFVLYDYGTSQGTWYTSY